MQPSLSLYLHDFIVLHNSPIWNERVNPLIQGIGHTLKKNAYQDQSNDAHIPT